MIRELVDTDGLSQTEAAGLLERHKSWVNRRLLMIRRLAPEIIEELKVELLPPGSAPALARVAACNQAALSAAIQLHGLSPREIRSLVALWCKATDPGIKQFLLRSSREALDVIKEEQSGLWPLQAILQRIRKHLQTVANRFEARREDLNRETMLELRKSLHQVNSGLSAIEQVLSKENR